MKHISVMVVLLFTLLPASALAVPSFARQTGMPCSSCHTTFPELTSVGRAFKLGAYALTTTPTVEDPTGHLTISATPPVSMMLQSSYMRTAESLPDSGADIVDAKSQNGTFLLPDQLSVFLAGMLSSEAGAFVQLTYDGAEDALSMDNADIRIAHSMELESTPLTLGLSLNNNPSVQDVWNSTPAWGFPYAASGIAPQPSASTMLDGALGQQVAGLGVYATYSPAPSLIYAEAAAYAPAQLGAPEPLDSQAPSPVLVPGSPYFRVAFERALGETSTLEVGGTALLLWSYPLGQPVNDTGTNRFHDLGLDAQYQYIGSEHIFTGQGLWIHEVQKWRTAVVTAREDDRLDTVRVTANYVYQRSYQGTLQGFGTWGTSDPGLYAPEPISGNRTGDPDSWGITGQLGVWPWENLCLALQYTLYGRFNGSRHNYDGSGRNASDNNTLFFLGWGAL